MNENTKKETLITAGLNLIPYVGGSIATIYTSIKSEKETNRINEFYKDISNTIETFDTKLTEILKNSKHDDEYLTMLIEKITRKIEIEARINKRNNFKALFINALLNGINQKTYSQIEFYTNTLDSLSNTEIELLALLQTNNKLVDVSEIQSKDFYDPYFILACVNKLRNFGLIEVYSGEIHVGARDNALNERIKLSELGKDFISYSFV